MGRSKLTTVITLTVSSVWALAALDAVAFNRVVPAEIVTPVMLAVVGFYMSSTRGNGGANDESRP